MSLVPALLAGGGVILGGVVAGVAIILGGIF